MNRCDATLAGLAAVAVSATAVHGWAHAVIPVTSPPWQVALVVVVLFVAPAAGVALLVAGRRQSGIWTLLLAGGAGLAFEGIFHFVVRNPDHVATVQRGHVLFVNTAGLTLFGDLLLVVGAGTVVWRGGRRSVARSARRQVR